MMRGGCRKGGNVVKSGLEEAECPISDTFNQEMDTDMHRIFNFPNFYEIFRKMGNF
ncbi:hypothetical protein GLF_2501 [Gluconobacter frateurii NBRC 101659]|nr:hypothetical protein GLF_2501 [Gluconobacter frateurii NBRC 101659]